MKYKNDQDQTHSVPFHPQKPTVKWLPWQRAFPTKFIIFSIFGKNLLAAAQKRVDS